jgi:hypothetical protein
METDQIETSLTLNHQRYIYTTCILLICRSYSLRIPVCLYEKCMEAGRWILYCVLPFSAMFNPAPCRITRLWRSQSQQSQANIYYFNEGLFTFEHTIECYRCLAIEHNRNLQPIFRYPTTASLDGSIPFNQYTVQPPCGILQCTVENESQQWICRPWTQPTCRRACNCASYVIPVYHSKSLGTSSWRIFDSYKRVIWRTFCRPSGHPVASFAGLLKKCILYWWYFVKIGSTISYHSTACSVVYRRIKCSNSSAILTCRSAFFYAISTQRVPLRSVQATK